MTTVPFSPTRVGLIAAVTLREAVRQKLVAGLALIACGFVLGVRALRDFNFGAPELKFIADFGDGVIAGFGAVLTIVLLAQLFFGELESRTALTLLAKPVWRSEFLLGKFFGVVAVVSVFCVLLTATLSVVLWQREAALRTEGFAVGPAGVGFDPAALWIAAWLHIVRLSVLAAGMMLVASIAQTQLYAIIVGFLGFVVCHLQHVAQGVYSRAGSAAMAGVATLIGWMFPDFHLFSLEAGGARTFEGVARLTIYGAGYAALALGLAVWVFRHREI